MTQSVADRSTGTTNAVSAPFRLLLLADPLDEGWHSMDLAADMLYDRLRPMLGDGVEMLRPGITRRLSRVTSAAWNADRFLGRYVEYPRRLAGVESRFDLFHICDHSFAHLVHQLPNSRVGVYCHDLDAFRCVLEPASEPRSYWFRSVVERVLSGLRRAAVVFHNTEEVGRQILRCGIVEPERLVHAPLGVAPEFTPEPSGELPREIDALQGSPYLLHVGSCIPRKRIDVLLGVFADVLRLRPELWLVRAGGSLTNSQRALSERLGVSRRLVELPTLSRPQLAEVYRRSALVLLPSEAEGFGFPIVEALACGAPVVASDIPALREAGGPAVVYRPVGDVDAWAAAAVEQIDGKGPDVGARLCQAAGFSWSAHARIVFEAYSRLIAS